SWLAGASQMTGWPSLSMSLTRMVTAPSARSHLNTGGPAFSSRSSQLTPVKGVIRLTVAPASEALARMIGLGGWQLGAALVCSLPPATLLPVPETVTVPPWIVSLRQPERELRLIAPLGPRAMVLPAKT